MTTYTSQKTHGKGNPNNITDPSMFDTSSGYDDEYSIPIAPNLTSEQQDFAKLLWKTFTHPHTSQGLCGLCVIKGDPGTGKDVFANYITYMIKTLFPWKKILRDEMPRPLYGPYAGLFNEEMLVDDLAKMRAIAKGYKSENGPLASKALDQAADDWVMGAGKVMLKDAILYLTEWHRYVYNREPNAPMNKTMGSIHKHKRHTDTLIFGVTQDTTELDKKTALRWIDWQVSGARSSVNPTGFTYNIYRVRYDKSLNMLVPISSPESLKVDAGKPITNLGDGKIKIKRPSYRPQTEEERIILDVIRAGYDTYEAIVELLYNEGDMEEQEVLMTLKNLSFNLSKMVLDYPCWFRIYNSKSAPNVKTAVRVEE